MEKPEFDTAAAHKYFSAECFNRAWDLIEKKNRSAKDDATMLSLTMASLWHWTQREDCTAENLSVAYWQISRVFALLHQPDNARNYGEMCLEVSRDPSLPPYCLGYAFEALARAAMLAVDQPKMQEYIHEAKAISEKMKDPEARKMLLTDLETIK